MDQSGAVTTRRNTSSRSNIQFGAILGDRRSLRRDKIDTGEEIRGGVGSNGGAVVFGGDVNNFYCGSGHAKSIQVNFMLSLTYLSQLYIYKKFLSKRG